MHRDEFHERGFMTRIRIKRNRQTFIPDPRHVIARYLNLESGTREKRIIRQILSIPEKDCQRLVDEVIGEFSWRHRSIRDILLSSFNRVKHHLDCAEKTSQARRLLIGAYFTHEYSVESTALFNPSIVPHIDQSALPPHSLRFIISFRAIGEGHISSIVFRSGVIDSDNNILMDPLSHFLEMPSIEMNSVCEVTFRKKSLLAERVISPVSSDESNGIEDARFVKFTDDDGSFIYFATYAAYNGHSILPKMLETKDFISFRMCTLNGKAAKGKGIALFPRKIDGKYTAVSRQDGENLFIMKSDNIYLWDEKELLKMPEEPWELLQVGNCGSPIETEYGWILLTHGVGYMRKYCIGVVLLDLHEPSKIIGSLGEPLIFPREDEREGYVPNVVYTCGALIHNGELIIPYAVSDTSSGIATVKLDNLIQCIIHS